MSVKKYAWVSGAKPCYTIHIAYKYREEFGSLHGLQFASYRDARDVARAVRRNLSVKERRERRGLCN